MNTYWLLKEENNHLLAVIEHSIYTGVIATNNKNKIIEDLEKGLVPEKMFGIPFSYVKRIECPKGKNSITIFYGNDSKEIIEIRNLITKKEVFNYLKESLSKFEYVQKKPSVIKHAKNQILAIIVVSALFIWTYYLANEISKGNEYEVVGNGGIGGLILGFPQFGKAKVLIGYIIIISIAVFSLMKRLRSISLTEYLIRK